MSESPEDVLQWAWSTQNYQKFNEALSALVEERDKAIRACAALRAGKEEAVRQRDEAWQALSTRTLKLEAENAALRQLDRLSFEERERLQRVVDAAREAKRLLEDGMDDEVWYVVLGLLREALDALDNGETDESS